MGETLKGYWWFLLIYVTLKSIYDFNTMNIDLSPIFLILFSIIFFIWLFVTNVQFTKNEYICGKENVSLGFYSTIFPFIFIYVLVMLIIHVFPGWRRGFSNTFGLTIIKFCGYSSFIANFKNMIKPKNNDNANANNNVTKTKSFDELYLNVIDNIYNNPEKFINELEYPEVRTDNGQENYIWPQLDNIIKNRSEDEEYNDLKKRLVGFMMIKDNIADYLWAAILSTITILVSQNQLLSTVCNKSDTNMNDTEFNDYLDSKLKEDN